MFPRAVFVAAVAALCADLAWSAIPFAVNHTELRRTHSSRVSNSVPPSWGRRRARDTIHLTTPPQLGTSLGLGTSSPFITPPRLLSPYWANNSLVGLRVKCSDAAKSCLGVNRLLHEPSGRCYELGDTRPCGDDRSTLVLDADAFRQGHLRSRCKQRDSCDAFSMAYDGKCYEAWEVFGKLCNGTKGVMYHPLGGLECEKREDMSGRKVSVIRQPNTHGQCIMPSFQVEDIGPFFVNCSSKDAKCLGNGLLPFGDRCYDPLSNATCPEGQWLVMDEHAAEKGHLRVMCMPVRPCGPHAQLLRADRTCHANEEVFEKLCYEYPIASLPTGYVTCTNRRRSYTILGSKRGNGTCEVHVVPVDVQTPGGAIWVRGVRCVMNDDNVCQPIAGDPTPKPDLSPE